MEHLRGRLWYRACGLSNVWLADLEYRTCPLCGCLDYAVPEVRSLFRKLVEAVIFKTTMLCGEEVCFLRYQLALPIHDFARLLCLSLDGIQLLEDGTRRITPLEDRVLRVVAAQQCLRWRYPLDRLQAIDPTRADAARVLLKLSGRKWRMVSM